MSKKRINISIDEETYVKLKQISDQLHTTASQFITDRIWEYDRDREQLRMLKYNQAMVNQMSNRMPNYAYEGECYKK